MCFASEIKCPVCGAIVPQKEKGRTKEYCSDNCKNFSNFLSAMETSFLKIEKIEIANKKEIRSKFWTLANLLNRK
jgi:hypothetical protein